MPTHPPGRDEVRLTVSACGICGTDRAFASGGFPNMSWSPTLGHKGYAAMEHGQAHYRTVLTM
jgi:D-arabinose 1-dehydrogenase-like Zn-dependent alcohol dehydrogenase